ncbi:MAG: hypothetical protein MUF30_05790 [Burkholderiales bacterium]|jgi:hypothetical protein|nr:hypothetical protein [Burkholderiales bacterium]
MNGWLYRTVLTVVAALTASLHAHAAPVFSPDQLSGWWAESYNTDVACGPQNLRAKHEFSADGKRLVIRFDRKWTTELGEMEKVEAIIVGSSDRTITIRYDGETRRKDSGALQEWELTIVAPGVYRWRETDWPVGEVNTVVGIRCSE